jgi:type II secretory pathway component HofQ
VVTETIGGVQNTIGALYNGIVDTFTATDDVNDVVNLPSSVNLTQSGYYDQRRNWDDSELIQVPSLHGKLPYFRIREIETEVTVHDGSTIGMGGLIYDKLETYRDKVPLLGSVPFLGRLFRSEGERSIKRNLIIFVTATQVDVNGQRSADLVLKQ